ncbi:hypothetical protein ACFPOI_10760 [Nonomuraea angiospora]|uniref:Uncharacterized protein n=1 Tax=Nonomuraea angiospora TaxID=46172 RepID=A0ABR9MAB6_9ACTN|nr:hypothetical protein [Nonomuraea angiospora]MBE1589851.1 hypothetical protein [Nonomuraea angiospora]
MNPGSSLDCDGAGPVADSVSYRQGTLWLSPDELAEMLTDLLTVLRERVGNAPAPGRAPYLLSAILFPPSSRPRTPPAAEGGRMAYFPRGRPPADIRVSAGAFSDAVPPRHGRS